MEGLGGMVFEKKRIWEVPLQLEGLKTDRTRWKALGRSWVDCKKKKQV